MVTSLALRNLTHSPFRTLVALGGVCFAVTLLFMQLGFFSSVLQIAMLVYDGLDYDLVLTAPHYVVLTEAGTFPERRLSQARANQQVERVMPVYVSRQYWRNPQTRFRRAVVMLGINPSDPVSRNPELEAQRPALVKPDTVLVDQLTRPEVGAREVGTVTDVGARTLTTIGQFTIGPGFEAGLVVVSDQTFARVFGGRSLGDVNVGLVKLRPGAKPEVVAEQLRRTLPADVRVLTRPELAAKERRYWVASTSTGIIFGTGVLVAVFFGIVITYQGLSLEVTYRLSEYATLKAMGFSDAYLSRVVLKQALIFALVSYVTGAAVALGIYHVSAGVTHLPIGMTTGRAVSVFFLNLLICSCSGLLSLRTLRRADPVDLF